MKGKMPKGKGGNDSDVEKEAEASKPDELVKRKRGGKIEGAAMKPRMDRPMRKMGGMMKSKGMC